MFKVENVQVGTSFKGYVHKSVYKHIENELINKASDLRREYYTFEAIPKFKLNQIEQEKKDIAGALEKLENVMREKYHKNSYFILQEVKDKDNKQKFVPSLGNSKLENTVLPMVQKTNLWYPERFFATTSCVDSIVTNLESPDVVKNNEADLLETWMKKTIKPFLSKDLADRLFRYLVYLKSKIISNSLKLESFDSKQIISDMLLQHNKNLKNKKLEKEFLKKLRMK